MQSTKNLCGQTPTLRTADELGELKILGPIETVTAIDVEIDIRVEMRFDRMQRRASALPTATTKLRGAFGPSR